MYCKRCTKILDLNQTKDEKQIGFASVLTIACFCGEQNLVHTAQIRCTDNGDAAYVINIKAAISLEKTNMSIRKLHDFFTDLNIPCLPGSKKLMEKFIPVSTKPHTVRATNPLPTVITELVPHQAQHVKVNSITLTCPVSNTQTQRIPHFLTNNSFVSEDTERQGNDTVSNQFTIPSQIHPPDLRFQEGQIVLPALFSTVIEQQAGPDLSTISKPTEATVFDTDDDNSSDGDPEYFPIGGNSDVSSDGDTEEEEKMEQPVGKQSFAQSGEPSAVLKKPQQEQPIEAQPVNNNHTTGTFYDMFAGFVHAENNDDVSQEKTSSQDIQAAILPAESSFKIKSIQENSLTETKPQNSKSKLVKTKHQEKTTSQDIQAEVLPAESSLKTIQQNSITETSPQNSKSKRVKTKHEEKAALTQGVRPENCYDCQRCEFFFSSFKALYAHLVKVHGTDYARIQRSRFFPQDRAGRESRNHRNAASREKIPKTGADKESSIHSNSVPRRKMEEQDEHFTEPLGNESGNDISRDDVNASTEADDDKTRDESDDDKTREEESRETRHDSDTETVDNNKQPSVLSSTNRGKALRAKTHACRFCSRQFAFAAELRRHTLKHKREKTHTCEVCNKSFTYVGTLNRHKRLHTGERPYVCGTCDMKFVASFQLTTHIKTEHREGTEGTQKTRRGGRKKNYRSATVEKGDVIDDEKDEALIETEEVDDDFELQQSRKEVENNQLDINEKPFLNLLPKRMFECRVCSAKLPSVRSFGQHMKNHPEITDIYTCPQCDEKFRYIVHFYRHMLSVHNARPYRCKNCGQTFRQAASYKDHRRKHMGKRDRPFMCETCGNTFVRAVDLRRHERSHTNDRAFRCKVCSKAYLQLSHLIAHRRTHTGERPFMCHKCGKAFAEKTTLRFHYETHKEGQGKIECTGCGKWLKNQRTVAAHQESCSGVYRQRFGDYRDFVCEKCGKDCKRRQGINHHRKIGCKGTLLALPYNTVYYSGTSLLRPPKI
ncbi:hypothetical protein V1264_017796 [Littorina saxatilis]|uniref:C2H2-type domain-containing protein n=1 Tax=Littorina saxatilis TaxID=31220 RepID=A0AAN9BJD8_9CAEN